MWPVAAAGLVMGLFSSFHCIGMCGPLALALPLQDKAWAARLFSIVQYHVGRLLTYSLLGLAFGLAGRRLQLAGWQQWFSILSGVTVLAIWAYPFVFKKASPLPFLRPIEQRLTALNLYLWRAPEKHGFLLLGMANGLLPCGMVYMAVAAALTTGVTSLSVLFMASFGLGTLPALVGFGYFSFWLNVSVRQHLRKAVPLFMLAMGVVLVLRGLDLNIPFISPVLPVLPGNAASCH